MPAPSGIKLRESCEACAASKVRCSKDKPNCNRCVERSIKCHYSVTQRTGRKVRRRDKPSDGTQGTTPDHNLMSLPMTASSSSSSTEQLAASGVPFSVPPLDAIHHSSNHCIELDEFLATLPRSSYFSLPGSPSHDPYIHSHNSPELLNGGDGMMVDGHPLGLVDIPLPMHEHYSQSPKRHSATSDTFSLTSPAFWSPSTTNSFGVLPVVNNLQHQHQDSLAVVLRLMEQLSLADKALVSTTLVNDVHGQPTFQPQSPQAVMDMNKMAMETINATLESPSSADGYFLVVVCLVLSKVLSRYTSVAQGVCTSGWDSRRSSTSTASAFTDKTDPKTAQCVLDELYSVQATVDQLGAKMQMLAVGSQTFGSESLPTDYDAISAAFPFSATVLNQLYIELRKRLGALSLEMIDQLKRYWT